VRSSRRRRPRTSRDLAAALLFLLPFIVGFAVFTLVPLVLAGALAFFDYDILSPPKFVGLANLQKLIADSHFWNAWGITFAYSLGTASITIGLGLPIGVLLYRARFAVTAWRVLYYIPAVISGAGEALMLTQVWATNGLVNSLLNAVGIDGPTWFSDPNAALPALIISRYWTIGTAILLFMGARASVPRELYEAADLDGASSWHQFRHVGLPMMSPVLLFVTVLSLIAGFQSFAQVYIMTEGGPARATEVMGILIYNEAFRNLSMGYAAALSWTVFAVTIVAAGALFLSGRRWVYYEGAQA
jgi:multiple sugar transport system permease protein